MCLRVRYYSAGRYQQLDAARAAAGMDFTHVSLAENPASVAGFKTQTTYVPAE